MSRDENGGPLVNDETIMLHQFSGTSSRNVGGTDLQQNNEVQVNAYSSRQFGCHGLPFENGGH